MIVNKGENMNKIVFTLLLSIVLLVFIAVFFVILDVFKDVAKKRSSRKKKVRRRYRAEDGKKLLDEEEQTALTITKSEMMMSEPEAFDTVTQECLVVVMKSENSKRAVGICAFLNDRIVEYFDQEMPECCLNEERLVDAAVAHWGPKWCYAEAVNLLCQDRALAKRLNNEWKPGSVIARMEEQYEFNLFVQWTENFLSDELVFEEVWEEIVVLARSLLRYGEAFEKRRDRAWRRFPLEHWHRIRVNVSEKAFHETPHKKVRKLISNDGFTPQALKAATAE